MGLRRETLLPLFPLWVRKKIEVYISAIYIDTQLNQLLIMLNRFTALPTEVLDIIYYWKELFEHHDTTKAIFMKSRGDRLALLHERQGIHAKLRNIKTSLSYKESLQFFKNERYEWNQNPYILEDKRLIKIQLMEDLEVKWDLQSRLFTISHELPKLTNIAKKTYKESLKAKVALDAKRPDNLYIKETKPKYKQTGYIMFTLDKRPIAVKQLTDALPDGETLKQTNVMRELARMWRELTELNKDVWKQKANAQVIA